MLKCALRRLVGPAVLLAAAALGGCVYSPYPGYYGSPYYSGAYPTYAPAYVAPPVVVGGGYWGRGYWGRGWR